MKKETFRNDFGQIEESDIPSIRLDRPWYTLREACELKGINYRYAIANPYTKPHAGKGYDALIGGRRVYSAKTIAIWLLEDDSTLARKAEQNDLLK
jgi:hypothetical protein